jgi:hypothetical protein
LAVTWLLAPLAFLVALPVARKFGWFWAEIPGHVRERRLGRREWVWEAGRGETVDDAEPVPDGLPIRIFIFTPFIARQQIFRCDWPVLWHRHRWTLNSGALSSRCCKARPSALTAGLSSLTEQAR